MTDARWVEGMPEAYERGLVPVFFRPFARFLAERVAGLAAGPVLELAAGTGALTAELVGRGLDVTATDLNEAMVAVGCERVPAARWQAADAMELPFAGAQFARVVSQFGLMFFPDKVAALAESRRVLAPGGSVLALTWGPVEEHAYGAAVVRALREVLPDDAPGFLERTPHGYHDAERVRADALAAGFGSVAVERVVLVGDAEGAEQVVRGLALGSPLRQELEQRGDLASLLERLLAVVERDLGPGPLCLEMSALLLVAA